ncbi:hypothetical protein PW035_09940 [Nonomuraea angiospora]|nr:hypothetical protein [Nonomuraea angiospora]MDX3101148.1 hypothetical protein [Nonomuraea angiospora]
MLVEDAEGVLPHAVGGIEISGVMVGVAERVERPAFEGPGLELAEQLQRPLEARDRLDEVAEAAVDVAETVTGRCLL